LTLVNLTAIIKNIQQALSESVKRHFRTESAIGAWAYGNRLGRYFFVELPEKSPDLVSVRAVNPSGFNLLKLAWM
jgi:hypothetical protein